MAAVAGFTDPFRYQTDRYGGYSIDTRNYVTVESRRAIRLSGFGVKGRTHLFEATKYILWAVVLRVRRRI